MNVSVCMATYNGADFAFDQLISVLTQLAPHDEVVVVDDGSTDATVAEVERAVSTAGTSPSALTLLHNPANVGHVQTFERALNAASNDLLVLADQDDIWVPGYLAAVRAAAVSNPSKGLIIGRPVFCDEQLVPTPAKNERYRHPRFSGLFGVAVFLANRAMPVGCTMSIRRADLEYLLPFPDDLTAHDHWIFAMATLRRRMLPIDHDAIYYRRHDGVVTAKGTLAAMISSRLRLLRQLARRLPMLDRRQTRRQELHQ